MTLLFEVLGVLLAGAAIAALVGIADSVAPRRAAGTAVVVVVLASVLFFGNIWGLISGLPDATSANANLEKEAAELAPGSGLAIGFLSWARSTILNGRSSRTFWLTAQARSDPFTYQWSTYQLLPAREADDIARADWIVFYNTNPAAVSYDRAKFGRLITFQPGYAVAQRTNAG